MNTSGRPVRMYFFSKRKFFLGSLIIIPMFSAIAWFASLFYPESWQMTLAMGSPLIVFILVLPNYIKTIYFLILKKPALIITRETFIDNFKGRTYQWSEIRRIELKYVRNGRTHYTILKIQDREVGISESMLDVKNILKDLRGYHNRFKNG